MNIRTLDSIGLSSVLRPRQHSAGYNVNGFYRSKDPTNSIKVLGDGSHRVARPQWRTIVFCTESATL